MIDAATVPFIDVTAVRMLDSLRDELEQRGIALLMARNVIVAGVAVPGCGGSDALSLKDQVAA